MAKTLHKSVCVLTGLTFQHPDKNMKVEPSVIENICYAMCNNEDARKVFFSAVVKDEECMNQIIQAMLTTNAQEVGLSVPGTLAEVFLSRRG